MYSIHQVQLIDSLNHIVRDFPHVFLMMGKDSRVCIEWFITVVWVNSRIVHIRKVKIAYAISASISTKKMQPLLSSDAKKIQINEIKKTDACLFFTKTSRIIA